MSATDIGFRIIEDGTITLELEDGAKLRLRQVVFNVLRTDEKTQDGERLYLVQSLNHVVALTPAKEDEP